LIARVGEATVSPPPQQLFIGGKPVGAGAPAFVIAEIGNTHEGSFGQAQALITAAAASGADAVKLQNRA
jgi:sialic acid synthase SpsE